MDRALSAEFAGSTAWSIPAGLPLITMFGFEKYFTRGQETFGQA